MSRGVKPVFSTIVLGAAGAVVCALPARAITFADAVFDAANSPTRPAGDPDGAKLAAHADEAAARWERALPDAHSISLTVRYDTAAPDTGRLEILGVSGGKATSVRLRVRPTLDWYFDSTPSSDGEFALAARFAQDDDPLDSLYPFAGTPPGRLETALSGVTLGANATKPDLLTVLIHHLGRALGFSDTFSSARAEIDGDGDVDVPSGRVAGNVMAVKDDPRTDPDDYSLSTINSVLNQLAIGTPGRRCVPSTLDYLVVAKCGGWTGLTLPRVEFLTTGAQGWNVGGNWAGGALPAAASAVFLRQAAPTTVTADSFTTGNVTVGGATTLQLNLAGPSAATVLDVLHNGNAFQIPVVRIQPAATLTTPACNLTGGTAEVNGTLRATSLLTSAAAVTGRQGRLRLAGSLSADDFSNSGRFEVTGDATAAPRALATATWDLDGNTAQTDAVWDVTGGDLVLERIRFNDAFDGAFTLAGDHVLTLWNDLAFGPTSRVSLGEGTVNRVGETATVTLRGDTTVTGSVRFGTDVVFASGSVTTLSTVGATLRLLRGADISSTASFAGSGTVVFDPPAGSGHVLDLPGVALSGLRLTALAEAVSVGDAISAPGAQARLARLELGGTNLRLDVGGTAPGTFDTVSADGAMVLDGRLTVQFGNFAPQPGNSWQILSAAQLSGSFDALILSAAAATPDPADFELVQTPTSLTLRMKGDPTLAEWLAARGVPESQRGRNDDPDADGSPNALEALLGMDPLTRDQPLLNAGVESIGGESFGTFTVRLLDQQFADIELGVEASTDLVAWNAPLLVAQSLPKAGTILRTWRLEATAAQAPTAFFRVQSLLVVDRPPVEF